MLSICVLMYNHPELTDACCRSLETQFNPTTSEIEWLVVDNGSEHSYERPGWTIHRLETNCGNIGGQNECFAHAHGQWVLFVSNDVRYFDGDALRYLWSRKFQGQLMPLILNPGDWSVQSSGGSYVWPGYGINNKGSSNWMLVDYCPSITYLMPKRVWERAGQFDDTLPGAYEDVEFGRRVETRCTDEAKVIHLGNATLQYARKDRWRFHQARQMVIRKHYKGLDRFLRLRAEGILNEMATCTKS